MLYVSMIQVKNKPHLFVMRVQRGLMKHLCSLVWGMRSKCQL